MTRSTTCRTSPTRWPRSCAAPTCSARAAPLTRWWCTIRRWREAAWTATAGVYTSTRDAMRVRHGDTVATATRSASAPAAAGPVRRSATGSAAHVVCTCRNTGPTTGPRHSCGSAATWRSNCATPPASWATSPPSSGQTTSRGPAAATGAGLAPSGRSGAERVVRGAPGLELHRGRVGRTAATPAAQALLDDFGRYARDRCWDEQIRRHAARSLRIVLAWVGADAPIPETDLRSLPTDLPENLTPLAAPSSSSPSVVCSSPIPSAGSMSTSTPSNRSSRPCPTGSPTSCAAGCRSCAARAAGRTRRDRSRPSANTSATPTPCCKHGPPSTAACERSPPKTFTVP